MPQSAVYTEATDRRPFFAIPWNRQLLVGTTEVADDHDPGDAQPSAAEIDYLLRSLALLFPRQAFAQSDVRYTFAGVRPLPYSPDKIAGSITRRHFLYDHSDDGVAGVISVIGGKLTTAASLARECVRKLGFAAESLPPPEIASAPLEELESTLRQWSRHISSLAGISEASAQALAEWHGRRAMIIARLAASSEEYRMPLCQHTEHLVAEAVAAMKSQHAVTLGDVLLRRVPVALGACWSEECSAEAAQKVGKVMSWTEAATQSALEGLERERIKFLNPSPGGRPLAGPTPSHTRNCAA
jgi:glycerol-3-phosphate dehydrogenase